MALIPERESKITDRDLKNEAKQLTRIRRWWEQRSSQYPYQVDVPLTLVRDLDMPELFDEYGPHICAHLKSMWRTYGFQNKVDAEAFVRKYPNRAKYAGRTLDVRKPNIFLP